MIFHQRFIHGLAIASYLIGDDKTGQAAVVDPVRDVDEYLRLADRNGVRIRHVLETHVHADYVSGSAEVKARLGRDVQVHCSGLGGERWTPPYADRVVREGDEVTMGTIRLKAMHTPGHTPEHVAWALYDDARSSETPWLLLTGDFVFVGNVGRPDLLGAEAQRELADQLYDSVFERISGVPEFTEVYPGHGAGSLCGKDIGSRRSSTLGYERRFNPALQRTPRERWVADLLHGMPPAPPYFARMKQVNVAGPAALGTGPRGHERLTARELRDRAASDGLIVLDVRPKEAFAAAHVRDSYSIPIDRNLASWAGWVLPADRDVALVADDADDLADAVTQLLRVGIDRIVGHLDGGIESWEGAGLPMRTVRPVMAQDLAAQLSSGGAPVVLDVRTDPEWDAGHIAGAIHVHGGLLEQNLGRVPRERPITIVCGSGYRSSIAASLLLRHGYDEVANVIGGMSAWTAAGLPRTTD